MSSLQACKVRRDNVVKLLVMGPTGAALFLLDEVNRFNILCQNIIWKGFATAKGCF